MIDLTSAVIGAVALANGAAVLAAAYLKGARDATAPDEVVDLAEVSSYLRREATINALRQDVDDGGDE